MSVGGISPLTISDKFLIQYDMKTGETLFDVVPYKVFDKTEVFEEIKKIGFASPFDAIKTELAV